jgi:uncharacterized protein with von Willebrand factor type A (vWA) domain
MDFRDLQARLAEAGYVAGDALAMALHLSLMLGRPLLLEGEAGVGKTEVAKALADVKATRLIRLQCYEGLDAASALYEWNYQRQLLAIRAAAETDTAEAVEERLFTERYLLRRPLLEAILQEVPPVLLIDEIDRADEAFEAYLLEVPADFQFTVPELGTIAAVSRPHVVLASNATRELSDALRRRCLNAFVEYPDRDMELAILARRAPGVEPRLAAQIVGFVQGLRKEELELVATRREVLSRRDLRELMAEADLREAERIAERLARAIRERRSRRREAAARGAEIDLRRTLRRALARGGEPMDLARRRRRRPPLRVVALLDVSGSMSVHARVFLAFLKGLIGADLQGEAFLFHTRLLRVTEALTERDPLRAAARLSLMAEGFGGGTRIGGALAAFNAGHAKGCADGRTAVLILSDRYDGEPPERLTAELKRLRRRAGRIVWLNPLKGWRDYAPVAAGWPRPCRISTPFCPPGPCATSRRWRRSSRGSEGEIHAALRHLRRDPAPPGRGTGLRGRDRGADGRRDLGQGRAKAAVTGDGTVLGIWAAAASPGRCARRL